MKQSPQMDKIQASMAPGVITLDGFLGSDKRHLVDIIIEDGANIQRLNVSNEGIASVMREFRNKGIKGLGEYTKIDPHFEVRVDSVRGKLPCPFGDPGVFSKTNIMVKNLSINKEIIFTDLHIHLIEEHGFFEGIGSPFRLDPKEVVEILEIPLETQ